MEKSFVSLYLVTQQLWMEVMGYNPSYFKISGRHPVECVSLQEVNEFMHKLDAQSNYTHRLPTQIEWDNLVYEHTIQDLDDVAWFKENSNGTTQPIATKPRDFTGYYDVLGNVCEWVIAHNGTPILKGGSWASPATHCTVSNYGLGTKVIKGNDIGFRIVIQTYSTNGSEIANYINQIAERSGIVF